MLSLFLFALLLPGTAELIIQTVGAFLPAKKGRGKGVTLSNGVVIIPAHNEEGSIAATIESVKEHGAGFAIAVIADNCSDRTGEVARSFGAEVLERRSEGERGKPYALKYAFAALLPRGYEWFAVIDADSSIGENFFEEMATALDDRTKAVQARYCIRNADASFRTKLMNIAFYSQYLRMVSKERLGLSTSIQGTGVLFRRELIEKYPLPTQYIAEDLAYHLTLVMKGERVGYSEKAKLFADMPATGEGAKSQRARWEGGRFRIAIDFAPRLAKELLRGNWRALEPLLDLLLLPLGYHMAALFLLLLASYPSKLALLYLALPIIHVLSSIYFGGGTVKDCLLLLSVPYYIFWKIVNFGTTMRFSRSDNPWIRTSRDK